MSASLSALAPNFKSIEEARQWAQKLLIALASGSYVPSGAAGGDLTGSYPNPTIAADAVTNAKLANVGSSTIKGRISGGSGDPEDLTAAQAKTVLAITESDVANLTTDLAAKVPTSRAINTTAPITGGGDLSADRTIAISNFTGDSGSGGAKGAVPAPAAGDAAAKKYLFSDGTWRTIVASTDISGTLPVNRGGTNSNAALNNNRLVYTSGGAFVEAAALNTGQVIVGVTGGSPNFVTLSGDATIDASGVLTLSTANAKRIQTTVTKTNDATLAALTDLTFNVVAGKSYSFRFVIGYACGTTGGVHLTMDGGTCTASAYFSKVTNYNEQTGAFLSSGLILTRNDVINANTATFYSTIIDGTITLVASTGGGTFSPRFAQAISNGTGSQVLVGSFGYLVPMP